MNEININTETNDNLDYKKNLNNKYNNSNKNIWFQNSQILNKINNTKKISITKYINAKRNNSNKLNIDYDSNYSNLSESDILFTPPKI